MIADALVRLKELENLLEGPQIPPSRELVSHFRQDKELLAELPAVFEGALESILERLESTAMFSEEACSFSQADLVASLSVWVEKAQSYTRKQLGVQE